MSIERDAMKVGILGSGRMGGKLGDLFTRAGHNVVFSSPCEGRVRVRHRPKRSIFRDVRRQEKGKTPEHGLLRR
jgi:prephenate dehydrogenase